MTIRKDSTAYSAPAPIAGENMDCSVRALAVAAQITYEGAHGLFARVGRINGKRTPTLFTIRLYAAFGWPHIESVPLRKAQSRRRMTLAQFLRTYPKGRYVVHRSGHAFAVIDGVVHDWASGTGPRSRVINAWQVL